MMPLQRACDAENQVRNKLSNGPRRAQSNGTIQSILRRWAYVNCRGYVSIPQSARNFREFKVAPRIKEFVLDRIYHSVKDFLFCKEDK